jgi:hypothetical protein
MSESCSDEEVIILTEENIQLNQRVEVLLSELRECLSVVDPRSTTISDVEKDKIALHRGTLAKLVSYFTVEGDCYIARFWRDYFALLLETLFPQFEQTGEIVHYLRRRVTENLYIPLEIRLILMQIVSMWIPSIEQWSEEPVNAFVCRNGTFAERFQQLLQENSHTIHGRRCSYHKYPTPDITIYFIPPADSDTVTKILEDFESGYLSLGISFYIYSDLKVPRDEGNFHYGDPYLNSFSAQLEFPLGVNFQPSTGRGTAGAVIRFTGVQSNFILNNAHVAFDGLSRTESLESSEEASMRHGRIEEFNRHCFHGSYEGEHGRHMDYAVIPCAESFEKSLQLKCDRLDGEMLCQPKWFPELWKQMHSEDYFVNKRVAKRGIATGVTGGLIKGIDIASGTYEVTSGTRVGDAAWSNCFTQPGDSGSLVLCFEDELGWFPIGLHYSGAELYDGYHSYILPLSKVFQHIALKNSLGMALEVQFLNPFFGKGSVRIPISEP